MPASRRSMPSPIFLYGHELMLGYMPKKTTEKPSSPLFSCAQDGRIGAVCWAMLQFVMKFKPDKHSTDRDHAQWRHPRQHCDWRAGSQVVQIFYGCIYASSPSPALPPLTPQLPKPPPLLLSRMSLPDAPCPPPATFSRTICLAPTGP